MSELEDYLIAFGEDGHILPLRQILSEVKIRAREDYDVPVERLAKWLDVPRSSLYKFYKRHRLGDGSKID